MNCGDFLRRIDAFVADTMEGPEELDFRKHLRTCTACRQEAVARDPVFLLSAVPLREPTAEQVQSCVGAVTALIHQDRLQRQVRKPRWRWMAAAAAAVMAVGAGLAWWSGQPGFDEKDHLSSESGVSVASHREKLPPPRVEVETPGSDLRVYQYADTDDGNTAVVYIVNTSLEL